MSQTLDGLPDVVDVAQVAGVLRRSVRTIHRQRRARTFELPAFTERPLRFLKAQLLQVLQGERVAGGVARRHASR